MPYSTPEEAYDKILSDAGASLPKRDAIDARIVDDVKHQTGRTINNADEIAGLIPTEEIHRTFLRYLRTGKLKTIWAALLKPI